MVLINTLGVIVALMVFVVFVVWLCTNGVKAVWCQMKDAMHKAMKSSSSSLRHAGATLSSMAEDDEESPMQKVMITTGKCDCCGKKFVGTTADPSPLQVITFGNRRRNFCAECVEKLKKEFNKEGHSKEVKFTESAEAVRGLFNDSCECKKESKKASSSTNG